MANPEKITVYVVRSLGGGIDGRDHRDKPKDCMAFLTLEEAERNIGPWHQKDVVPRLVDIYIVKVKALIKLTAVERLVLELK